MEKRTGNKGEWSEFYVFLKLLAEGKIYAADKDVKKISDVYFPIMEIYRRESDSSNILYTLEDGKPVEVYFNGDRIKSLPKKNLIRYAAYLYSEIMKGSKSSAFAIDLSGNIMDEICCDKIKAPSTDKTDIKLKIHDPKTGLKIKTGFSIKSELGAPPTLLNASGATNFIFECPDISDSEMTRINSIDSKSKVTDRVKAMYESSTVTMKGASHPAFSGNLMLIDSLMEKIVCHMLEAYYRHGYVNMTDIVTYLENSDPIGFRRPGIYRYKVKKLLSSIALGMVPSKKWDGRDEANGGYIIVKQDGDVLAYHLYNRDAFETYLLNNTKLETASTKKHGFAEIIEADGIKQMKLNLQIRFI